MRLYYAQNKEDLFIKGFFPDVEKGFYIDVGANDPVIDSVTKLLYDEGWSGMNVEPIARHFKALQEQRARDINLNIGLSNEQGSLTFREYVNGDGLSTFDASMIDFYEKGDHPFPTAKFEEYEVPVKTLEEVVSAHRIEHIHFIKVDVEGYEFEVLGGYGWVGVRPELVCIEANHISKDWRPLLKQHHYHEVFFDGINGYYLADEAMYRKDFFNYPDIALSGNPVYYPTSVEIEQETTLQVTEEFQPQVRQLKALSVTVRDMEAEIASLHRRQRDVRFLAKQLSAEVQLRLNRRAKGTVAYSGLAYRPDHAIANRLTGQRGSASDLLAFIHKRDAMNIGKRRTSPLRRLKPLPWKIAAKSFFVGQKVARKLARSVLYG